MISCFFIREVRFDSTNKSLRPGWSLSSYGTNCAALSGIPQEVIARAEQYTLLQSRGEDLVGLIRGETNDEEQRDLKSAEEIAKRFVAWEINMSSGNEPIRTHLAKILG